MNIVKLVKQQRHSPNQCGVHFVTDRVLDDIEARAWILELKSNLALDVVGKGEYGLLKAHNYIYLG